ncbi:hypothetical protein Hanom_Chr09g00777881 [Helianthus anomalus]
MMLYTYVCICVWVWWPGGRVKLLFCPDCRIFVGKLILHSPGWLFHMV